MEQVDLGDDATGGAITEGLLDVAGDVARPDRAELRPADVAVQMREAVPVRLGGIRLPVAASLRLLEPPTDHSANATGAGRR